MLLVSLSSAPAEGLYEHGLELSLAAADMEQDCAVLLSGAMCRGVQADSPEAKQCRKKLKQCELFEVPLYWTAATGAVPEELSFASQVDAVQIRALLEQAQTVLTF